MYPYRHLFFCFLAVNFQLVLWCWYLRAHVSEEETLRHGFD